MASKKFPDGVKDFRTLVSGKNYFVDKTMMIRDVWEAEDEVLLYTRPRRFGKSINLSMLDYFFNLKYKDEPDIFKGLKITSCEGFEKHKNAYPVIRMDFHNLQPSSLQDFEDSLKELVSSVSRNINAEIRPLLSDKNDIDVIDRCISRDLGRAALNNSVAELCNLLERVYGKAVMIFVDEYDHFIQNITDEKTYYGIIDRIKPFMECTFKMNRSMRTGVITGIMPITKAGMLSSFNNPVVCDIFSLEGDEFFGFTEKELNTLLEDCGFEQPEVMDEIREWYDGYRFGDAKIYNPFSVIKYLKAKSLGEANPALNYWEGSTSGGMSSYLISRLSGIALQELSNLYKNPNFSVRSVLKRAIAYPDLFANDADPALTYSYLAMAGYLRTDPAEEVLKGEKIYSIGMVNREIRTAFESLVKKSEKQEDTVIDSLKKHIFCGNAAEIRDDLQFLIAGFAMDRTWSGDADSEDPEEKSLGTGAHDRYKNAITAALRMCGMEAAEEIPKGFGKCDIFVPGNGKDPAVAIEIKTSSISIPFSFARKARAQIFKNGYASEPADEKAVWIALGINGKRISVITPNGSSESG